VSTETVTERKPKCDHCGKLGSYGQMMPWPHSGWVAVSLSSCSNRLDFCSQDHAIYWLQHNPGAAVGR
jgi:hypothetical protein